MPLPSASARANFRCLRGASTRCSWVFTQSARGLPSTLASSSSVVSRASSLQMTAGRPRERVSGSRLRGRPLMAASYHPSMACCIRSVTSVLQPMMFSMSAWFIMRSVLLSAARRPRGRTGSYRCCGWRHQHTRGPPRRSFCRWHTHILKTPGRSTGSAPGR